ncbi:CHAT domain-containing protein, partial [bacterium]|nr:CHAT domain-containing protein [bacterium]
SQQLGRREEAAARFAELERRSRAAADDFHTGKALYGLGRLQFRLRDLAGADSLYSLALPFLEASGDSADLAPVYNGLGNCRVGRGAFREARLMFSLAARMARAGGSLSLEAMATNNLAGIEMTLGDPAAAVAGYRRSRDIQRERGLWQQVGPPWRNLALALMDLGLWDEARAELEECLGFGRERGFVDQVAITSIRLAEVDLGAGRPDAALARCRDLLADPDTPFEVGCNAGMRGAEALLRLGRPEEALAELDAVGARLGQGRDFTLEIMLAIDRGRVLRALGRHAEAVAVLRAARVQAAETGVAGHRLLLVTDAAESWFALGQRDSTRDLLDAAEGLWEQDRALPTDPQWRERRGAEAQKLFGIMTASLLQEGDVAGAFAAVQRYKARTLLERMLGPGDALPPATDVPPPVSLARLRGEILGPGEVLLDVLAGTDQGLLFVATRDTCLVVTLPGEERWEEELSPLLASLAHPFGPFDRDAAAGVAAALAGPPDQGVAAMIRSAGTIFFSPDGVLHRLPLAAIHPDADVRRLPSATILAHLRGRADVPGDSARILAIAGHENPGRQRLAGARAETALLARRFANVTVPAGVGADSALFGGEDPEEFDLLHLACHGEVDPDRPWNSALVFGTADEPVLLRAGPIADLSLQARLAVLSSCESAAGGILAGEGILGLGSGFLAAGVPAVVATLWPVEDQATFRFCEAFYGSLARQGVPARALIEARSALRSDPATAHPF